MIILAGNTRESKPENTQKEDCMSGRKGQLKSLPKITKHFSWLVRQHRHPKVTWYVSGKWAYNSLTYTWQWRNTALGNTINTHTQNVPPKNQKAKSLPPKKRKWLQWVKALNLTSEIWILMSSAATLFQTVSLNLYTAMCNKLWMYT